MRRCAVVRSVDFRIHPAQRDRQRDCCADIYACVLRAQRRQQQQPHQQRHSDAWPVCATREVCIRCVPRVLVEYACMRLCRARLSCDRFIRVGALCLVCIFVRFARRAVARKAERKQQVSSQPKSIRKQFRSQSVVIFRKHRKFSRRSVRIVVTSSSNNIQCTVRFIIHTRYFATQATNTVTPE